MLKVGIAGYGIVGKRRGECIKKNNKMQLVAVCDKTFNSRYYQKNKIKFYKNYQDLIKEELDILFICLTNDIASKVTIKALQKNINVFCEKPPAKTLEEIEKVIAIKNKKPKLKLKYGFNHRYHHSVKEALRIIKSKELGNLINLRCLYGKSKLITFDQPDWRTKRKIAGGGVLLDQGIHMVDLMRLFAGEFNEIKSFVLNNHWNYDVEDNAYAIMKTKDNIVGMLNSSATQWRHKFNMELNLDKGSLILSGILSSSKSYGEETLTIIKSNFKNKVQDSKENTKKYNDDPSWEAEVDDFANIVIDDLHDYDGNLKDAYRTMKLVYLIYYEDVNWRKKFKIKKPK